MKLFDLFRRKKPEPPAFEPDADGVVEALRAAGLIPEGATATVHVVRGGMPSGMPEAIPEHRVGIKPPADALVEGWTWQKWRHEQQINALPGWAFCRFANRVGEEHVEFVFGLTNGSFGLWQQPFRVCLGDNTVEGGGMITEVLTCITLLSSGRGLGIFKDRAVAAEAAVMADRIGSWSDVDPDNQPSWIHLYDRTVQAWSGIGVRVSADSHCHDDTLSQGRPMAIFVRDEESAMAGRPEKLS